MKYLSAIYLIKFILPIIFNQTFIITFSVVFEHRLARFDKKVMTDLEYLIAFQTVLALILFCKRIRIKNMFAGMVWKKDLEGIRKPP